MFEPIVDRNPTFKGKVGFLAVMVEITEDWERLPLKIDL